MPLFRLAGKAGHLAIPAPGIMRMEPGPGGLTTNIIVPPPPGNPGFAMVEVEGSVSSNWPAYYEEMMAFVGNKDAKAPSALV
jgi:hypothetical protein